MALAWSILLLSHVGRASERKFDVKDDIFAFPQYDVSFSGTYIREDDALAKLAEPAPRTEDGSEYQHEYMVGNGRPYLCAIPHVRLHANDTDDSPGPATEQDLVAAADRGWQLLQDMEGQQCLYYTTGWWSYMFCYNSYVKQYHALAVSPQGHQWPPPEDPNTPSYILGSYESLKAHTIEGGAQPTPGDLQTQSETTFLVQRLDGGTACDLTGKPRKIEVQYHCSPGTPDRIGWIKETATCAYQMVVYTSRLCNDVVFQPPKDAYTHTIECQAIMGNDVPVDEHVESTETPQIEDSNQPRIMLGKIEFGAKKWVGREGKTIERGRIVMTPEEQAEIVVMQKDGQIQSLSSAELRKLELNPEEVAAFQKEMQKLAGKNDWKIERLGDAHGQLSLRGVVDSDKKDKKDKNQKQKQKQQPEDEENADVADEVGSEEHFKHEL